MRRAVASVGDLPPNPDTRHGFSRNGLARMWSHAAHLVHRFFEVARPEPLTPAEQRHVAAVLGDTTTASVALFWSQSPADQRHAYATMRRTAASTTSADVLIAALLHDVGKGAGRIGAVGRTVATLLDMAHLPMTASMRSYRDHGSSGALLLETAGAPTLAVEFARRHPDTDPGSTDPAHWQALLAADGA